MSTATGERRGEFRNVIRSSAADEAMPVDEYLHELDRLIAATFTTRDRTTASIGDGTAPASYVRTIAKEYYYLGRWMTPEFPIFIANAPDAHALTLEHSEHYAHWCQNFADEVGYLRDPNHVRMKWEWCQQLGITAEELEA